MMPELGQLALILALCLATLLGTLPLIGTLTGQRSWQALARPLAAGQFVFMMLAFLVLVQAFVGDDFSVAYVANNSNSQLPVVYKVSAVWGGHEGSLLLWGLILCGWTLAVAIFSRELPLVVLARVLSVMGLVSIGFQLFMLLTSNPFTRILPYPPADGSDLNPLLQDFGLIVHPPMLYMGYVGFSVAFAFAIAALMGGRLDAAWARWSRPWTVIAWVFLTLGIALGSWWAYYELGWGGWWFWDPVENASFMPWLVGTALIHSLAVSEKRGLLKSWTVLLAISAFSLSLLGTFLVRSGVLTSVHAFATDPTRGAFILAFLIVVVGSSLLLFALRAPVVKSKSGFKPLSLETFLLINNIILTSACAVVLLGTLYPLAIDALGLGKISVGPPFFNASFVPMTLLLALTLGVGVTARWKNNTAGYLMQQLRWAAMASIVLGMVWMFVDQGEFHVRVLITMTLVFWITLASVKAILNRCRNQSSLVEGLKTIPRSVWGMHIAHIGLAVSMVGVLMVTVDSHEQDLRMAPGDVTTLKGYEFRFEGVRKVRGPNYISDYGTLRVFYEDKQVALMHPEKRFYNVSGSVMTEAAIDPGLFRDLYAALGEDLGNGAWAIRVQFKAFVRWIWLGSIFMSIGGALAVMDKRYRMSVRRRAITGKGSGKNKGEASAPQGIITS
ncbi:heme lyase CcmF/NrfE family subunit [Sansalvadorimonas verongulae]|uniref:heme lyase CcmF/NrfE family subunit n=1 Tax=Sansalvadorimonas verongulae TaxID=2172824 RepID=UPI0012BD49F3|nr:heme lyase CcmF/NrfE family subunit [Sansalvadorimonas verongulae]MTI13787.1 heme lyase CcmF/NrfE family subunit [Sansalvadorimonas verongulae]